MSEPKEPSAISWRPSLPARLPFFYGWVILPAAALALFASGPGQTFSISVFVDPFIEEFGWSRTTVSGLYAAGSLSAAGAMFAVGLSLDRFGARTVLATLGALMALALLWMSTVDNELDLYFGFVALRMIGQGSLTLVATSLVAVWFIRKRGRVTALAGLGMMAAQVVYPPLGHALIEALGWRSAWMVLAAIVAVMLVPTALLVVRRSPESVGLRPDGVSGPKARVAATAVAEQDWTLRAAMATRAFWLILGASSSQSLVSTALVFHQVDVLGTRGVDAAVSAVVLSVMGPASFAGVMSAGILADRFANRYLLAAGQAMIMVGMVLVMFVAASWQAFIYGAVLGFAGGFAITISAVIWPSYFGRSHMGAIRGVATTMMVASAAIGPVALSLGYDLAGGYSPILTAGLVLPGACAVMAYAARPPTPAGA